MPLDNNTIGYRWRNASTIQDLEHLKETFSVHRLADVAALIHCLNLWDMHSNNVLQIVPENVFDEFRKKEKAIKQLEKELSGIESEEADERTRLNQRIDDLQAGKITLFYANANYQIIDFLVGWHLCDRASRYCALSALLEGGYNDLLRDSTVVHQLSKSSFWEGSWWDWLWRRPSPVQRCIEECHRVFKDAGYPDDVISANRKLLELCSETCHLKAINIKNATAAEIADGKTKFLEENQRRVNDPAYQLRDLGCNIC